MSLYLFFADRQGLSGGSRWAIMGMAVKLAQSVSNLARDSCTNCDTDNYCFRLDFVRKFLISCLETSPNIPSFVSTDRDTGRWKLDASETQQRREVFWELYVHDLWQASKLLHAYISPYVFHAVHHLWAPPGLLNGPGGL